MAKSILDYTKNQKGWPHILAITICRTRRVNYSCEPPWMYSWSCRYLVSSNYWSQRINFLLDIFIKKLRFNFQTLLIICSSTQGEEIKPKKLLICFSFLKVPKWSQGPWPGRKWPSSFPVNWNPVSQVPGLFSVEDFAGINFIKKGNPCLLMGRLS